MDTDASWPTAAEAVARVREIQTKLHHWAKDDPNRRFDDLYNLVCDPSFLVIAWRRVKVNRGARSAGVDAQTAYSIRAEVGEERFLSDLRRDLKARTFRPLPVRERMIPKAGGKRRRLGIPTVRDRVVQAALKLVLEPIFKAEFQPCSYGFRPRRRAQDAIAEIHHFCSRSYEWVLELDSGVLYLRHQVAPDVQADGGTCVCGSRCGRAAVVEELKTEASTRGLELPEVLGPALRRQALRVERMRQLRMKKGKEWLEHGLVTPSARGGPMQPQRARSWLETLAAQAGLPEGCRFHDLRHMWVSLLRAAGVSEEDVAKAAGHASPQVTMSMYAHALAGSARRVADTVNRLVPIDPDDTSDEQALRSTLLALRVRRASVRGSTSDGGSQG